MNYTRYLSSEHWRSIRDAKLLDAGDKCQKCKRRSCLQVHHLTYERLGFELLSDLMVLCEKCHEKEHNLFPSYQDDWQPPKKKNKRVVKEREENPLLKYIPKKARE